ncbi:S1C family serine protease [Miniimonas arenae]|uniref:S1C family serine protease n=1 Tax=Miniimonas arenae TaxID=676201 RepID=UPI001C55A10C|nr:trypsin-like peptidase domain-containing protein [Miniimonas arenae]
MTDTRPETPERVPARSGAPAEAGDAVEPGVVEPGAAWPWPEPDGEPHPHDDQHPPDGEHADTVALAPVAGTPRRRRVRARRVAPRRVAGSTDARRRSVGVPAVAAVAVLALLVGTLTGLLLAPRFGIETAAPGEGSPSGAPVVVTPAPSTLPTATAGGASESAGAVDIVAIAAEALPSTVAIDVTLPDGTGSSGSGMVLRADGYVLTNAHVVSLASTAGSTLTVIFSDGSQSRAQIVGQTVDYDLAVLRVERTDLVPLSLGDSDALVVGQPVVAVGAPLGLQGTVTSGIVSALNRPVTAGDTGQVSFINAIQTDAAINPGNSGGPLLDATGAVIGINSAIAQASGQAATGSIGLGFAIPANQARRTAEELIAFGYATYPVVGVLLDSSYTGEGVRVATTESNGTPPLTPGGPAETAGVQPGDVILAIDGQPVTLPEELIVAIRAHAPGDVVTLTVREGGTEREVAVTLGSERSE